MAAKSTRRPRVGDVFEVRTAKGLAYIQFVGMHPMNAHTIRLFMGTHASRPSDVNVILASPSYVTFYPVHWAVRDGEIEYVASCAIPENFKMPMKLINSSLMMRDGKVPTWVVKSRTDRSLEWLPLEEVRGCPIEVLAGYRPFVRRIETGWTPEHELQRMIEQAASPPPPLELPAIPASDSPQVEGVSSLEAPHRTTHFFFFPRKKSASAAADALRERGFQIADLEKSNGKWMLVAETRLVPGAPETDEVHDSLERLAARHGGQYVGWETEV